MMKFVLAYRESLGSELKIRKFHTLINLTDYLQTYPDYVTVTIAKEL